MHASKWEETDGDTVAADGVNVLVLVDDGDDADCECRD